MSAGQLTGAENLIGEIKQFAGIHEPKNWAFCDGRELSISKYPALHAVIGNRFGGDGQATFKLPDMRGKVAVGVAAGYEMGATGGAETINLQENQLPAHTHELTNELALNMKISEEIADSYSGNMAETIGLAIPPKAGISDIKIYKENPQLTKSLQMGELTGNISAAHTGSGDAIDIRQPYVALNYIIRINGEFPYQQ